VITRSSLRTPAVAALGVLVGGLTLGSAVARPALQREADALEAHPAAISIVRHDLAPGLFEVGLDRTVDPAGGVGRLLAVSADGRRAAIAGRIGPEATVLTTGGEEGAQQVQLPGLIAAAFSADGSWLAAIDGTGRLWRVADGAVSALPAAGTFAGELSIEPDDAILALRVSSVEAPITATPVRISPDGTVQVLSDERLVYGIQRLADGSLAIAAHRASSNVVLRVAGGERLLADLGPDAVHASISARGDMVAFERAGQVFVQRAGAASARPIGPGSNPRIAPDGQTVLVELPIGSVLLALDGRELARFASQAAFAPCGECRP
jgi:hypothetical protein